jgi:S1-C subfamily serine protease
MIEEKNQNMIEQNINPNQGNQPETQKRKGGVREQIGLYILVLSLLVGIYLNISSFLGNYFKKFKRESLLPSPSPVVSVSPSPSLYSSEDPHERAVIEVIKKTKDAVVSIVITKKVPVYEEYYENPFEEFFGENSPFLIPKFRQKGTEEKEVGGGTGFFVSSDGLIITNNHVVEDEKANYTVITNDGKKYSAKVLIRDSLSDLALLRIEGSNFPFIELGDSDTVLLGQTVIAIGNALAEFRNTISVGVISGLGRNIVAQGGNLITTQYDVIQTDAAINQGNSGGPLLNLKGEAIGVNFAMVVNAQNIGFAIPINRAKRVISQYHQFGKVVYPFLGVRYILINEQVKKEKKLSVDYGALIISTDKEPAVIPGSPADKAGLKEGDIILEINNEKITVDNPLIKVISKYNPGDKVTLKILRGNEEKTIELFLVERKNI